MGTSVCPTVLRNYVRSREVQGEYRKRPVAKGKGETGIRPLMVANWNMPQEAGFWNLVTRVHWADGKIGGEARVLDVDIAIVPPLTLLSRVSEQAANYRKIYGQYNPTIFTAAWSLHWERVRDAGAHFAIIGHSEWRAARRMAFPQRVTDGLLEQIRREVGFNQLTKYLGKVGNAVEIISMAVDSPDVNLRQEPDQVLDVGHTKAEDFPSPDKFALMVQRSIDCETDGEVNRRVTAALNAGLSVILCVGETLEERNMQRGEDIIRQQMIRGLAGLSANQMEKVVIAYEPGMTVTPQQVDAMQGLIREIIHSQYGEAIALALRILYGGPVTPDDIGGFMSMPNIDGVFVDLAQIC